MKLITNKSKNLLYCISVEDNVTVQFGTSYAVATQRTADSASVNTFKIQGWDGTKYTGLAGANIAIGKLTTTFTTPSTTGFKLIRFGLNGASIDTLCRCEMDLKPSTTYTFTCNFTNITQGSISWKDMMLVEGSTAGEYEPYSYNLLDKWKFDTSNSNYINNGDGSITTTGTVFSFQRLFMDFDIEESSSISKENSIAYLTYGHKLLINDNCNSTGTNQSNAAGCIWEINSSSANAASSYGGKGEIYTNNKYALADMKWSYFYIINRGGEAVTCAPALYDLTLMYGAGNEPTTVEQFYTDYPELKVSPLGFIGLKNLEISNKNIKRLRYATTTRNLFDLSLLTNLDYISSGYTLKQLQLKPNTTYSISTINSNYYSSTVGTKNYARLLNSDNSLLVIIGDRTNPANSIYPNHPRNFTTDSTGKIGIGFNCPYTEDAYKQFYEYWFANLQIEEGSTATPYVPYGYLDLGIIPSNSGYILDKYNNLSEELLEENIEKPTGSWNNRLNELTAVGFRESTVLKGINFINNGDGSWTIEGKKTETTIAQYAFLAGNMDFPVSNGDKLLVTKVSDYSSYSVSIYFSYNRSSHGYITDFVEVGNTDRILTVNNDSVAYVSPVFVIRTNDYIDITVFPQVYNLTKIYGAGKEPATVDEFYKDYPGLKTTANYHIPDKTNILLNKVDGKTNKIVQLADKSKYDGTSTTRGITFTNNGNGTITINGTNDGTDYSDHPITNSNYLTNDWLKGRKYLFYFSDRTDLNYYAVIGGSTSKMEYTELGNTSTGRNPLWTILSPTDNSIGGNSWYILRVKQNAVCTNELASPQVFDLTAMYGFGNEPTTVEQFKKDYPQFFDEKLDGIWNVRTSGISSTGKNLFDISKWIISQYDVAHGTLVERLSNGAICQGDNGTGDGDGSYSNGWFRPMSYQYPNSIYLQAGTYTLSADYTMIENSVVNTANVNCYLYGDHNYTGSYTSVTVGNTVKVKNTYTVEEGYYYPVFTLNSGKVKIENIQIELNSTATSYEHYQENKIDLLSTQTLNGINGVNDYIEVIDKGNGLYDLKKTQNIDSVDMGSLGFDADGNNFVTGAISSDIKPPVNDNSVGNYICQKYVNCALNKSFVDGDFGVNSSGYVYFRDSAYTTVSDFQTAVTGTMFYYQLKTPVVTTIATNLTYNQVSAIRTNGGLLLVNDNNNQKYVQPDVTLKANYQYKS